MPQMALLGIVAGVVTGGVMLLFRALIELPLRIVLPGGYEHFGSLSVTARAALVVVGGLVLALFLRRLKPHWRSVGVVHVMERLAQHDGRMPLPNALVQFAGGALSLLTGQSGGREGPAIHLGAAAGSQIGRWFDLPNNSTRSLVACGTAAAIAGSFDTPLAGVVFAMEVVMMEYTTAGFIPVVLAAVTAALVSEAFLGSQMAFAVPRDIAVESLRQYPIIVVEGFAIGGLASAMLVAVRQASRASARLSWTSPIVAALVTACVCVAVPQVMGIGYQVVGAALTGTLPIAALATIGAAKLVVSAIAYGLRVPVGIIGPILVVGACAGAVFGVVGHWLQPDIASSGVYAMLGMGAMMGAALHAPLAALVALVELTGTPNITLPAMVAIVVATMTTHLLFKQRSVFLGQLHERGVTYPLDPVDQHLQRAGVSSVMNRAIVRLRETVGHEELATALRSSPDWIVVEGARGPLYLLREADLRRQVEALEPSAEATTDGIELEHLAVPRVKIASIQFGATMLEARKLLEKTDADALCIRRVIAPLKTSTLGVLTRADVLRFAGR